MINFDNIQGPGAIVSKEIYQSGKHSWNIQILTNKVNWIGVGVMNIKDKFSAVNKEKYYLCGSTLLSHNMNLNMTADFKLGSIFKCNLDLNLGTLLITNSS